MKSARPHYRSAHRCTVAAFALAVALGVLHGGAAAAAAPSDGRARSHAPGDAADDAGVRASMQCDRASEPGRVRCTAEARSEGGRTIAWADVEIVALPDFATALKGRIGRDDATSRDGTSAKWAFALVARRAGQGEARARVRVVVCAGPGETRCAPVVLDVRAPVIVGS